MLLNRLVCLTGLVLLSMPLTLGSLSAQELRLAQVKPRPRGTSVGLLSEHRRLARQQYESPIQEELLALSHQDGYNNEQTIARGRQFCEQMEMGDHFANDLSRYLSGGAGDDPPVGVYTVRANRKLIAYGALRGFCTPGRGGVMNRTGNLNQLTQALKQQHFSGWN